MGWAAAAQAADSLGAGAMQYFGQQQTNALNERMLQQQENFQLEMSNTAHQREVNDLKAAGLNPILSASGSGAPMGSTSTPTLTSPVEAASSGVSSMAKNMADLLNSIEDSNKKSKESKLIEAHTTSAKPEADVMTDLDKLYGWGSKKLMDNINSITDSWNYLSGRGVSGAAQDLSHYNDVPDSPLNIDMVQSPATN